MKELSGMDIRVFIKYRGQKSKELPQDEWVRLNQLLEEARKNHVGLWGKYYNVMECLCR
ncbi:hypothetical protein DMNBHIDG_01076 [Candidatus Methanoperedenaceae archaeon GB37]|nr:hypothetical protein DMNBHIDG_01076 [Candidatus Methanoperedenaceae archaeon GB37]